jgi:3-deoxy-7-phosphoheptulonate synthase
MPTDKRTDNLRISRTRPLLAPAILEEEIPLTEAAAAFVADTRKAIENIIAGKDSRLLAVVGPCSIHDPAAALEYARRLADLSTEVAERILMVMRVYFEKPRSIVGWKGLINDPGLDGTYQINRGLRLARQLLADLSTEGLAGGTEFLDTTFGQFFADFVSWGAIGARTVESQIHRELASGLSMPVGIKNRTDGNVHVAIDAIRAAGHKHLFPSLTREGAAAILETTGNPYCHLVLRGGDQPNYDFDSVRVAEAALAAGGVETGLMIDCSHGNSGKDPARQPAVVAAIGEQIASGNTSIRGLMIESHLVGGRQDADGSALVYGQSITDACLDFDATRTTLLKLAEQLK